MRPKKQRLTSLDGIRGFSMILVFLNHISPAFAASVIPSFIPLLGTTVFASGVLGVSFLFILTGFLMAYIYPNPSPKTDFLQKRYTRIFPLFLTMAFVMLVLRNFPSAGFLITIPIILIAAFLTHLLWVYVIKKIDKKIISRSIFITFLILQVVIGFIYSVVIIKFPPIVFNEQIPAAIRETLIGLVNATLTLPLGNYIPMLDGVYWSLASEILFYVLYPIICAPLIIYLTKKRLSIKILFLISLFPLFAGADILSHKILVISMLQISLFYYFVIGMVLGILYRNRPYLFKKITPSLGSLIIFIVSLLSIHLFNNIVPPYLYPLVNLLWSIPFGIVIYLVINNKTYLSKFFNSKFLVFIGLISYSIYLSHTAIIHMMEKFFKPGSIYSNIGFILTSFIVTVGISCILYYLLERPYFLRSEKKESKILQKVSTRINTGRLLFIICLIYLISLFFAFQSDFNFFSAEYSIKPKIISSTEKISNSISIHNAPLLMEFTANDDRFGVITMHVIHKKIFTLKTDINSQLIFKIKEKGESNWYSISGYDLYRIDNSIHHPFGFPQIEDSKNKTYVAELSLSNPKGADYIVLDRGSIKGIYPIEKLKIIKQPLIMGEFIKQKFITVFNDNQARYSFLLFLPFLSMSIYLIISDSISKKRYISI